jgi:hypothetical protein
LFYFRENKNGLKKIQFSNSNFSEIHSENTSTNTNDGGVAYIRVKNFENVVMENCIFEHCKGVKYGGVFFLYGNSTTGYKEPYIYLNDVTFLGNSPGSEEFGGDIYCPTNTCMKAEGKTIIDGETCTTSINSIRFGLIKVETGNAFPNYIPTCNIPPVCTMNSGQCSSNCVKFDIIIIFVFIFILFRFNDTCRESCPNKYFDDGGECKYECPEGPLSGTDSCVYSFLEIISPSPNPICYYYKPSNECLLECPTDYVRFIYIYLLMNMLVLYL